MSTNCPILTGKEGLAGADMGPEGQEKRRARGERVRKDPVLFGSRLETVG